MLLDVRRLAGLHWYIFKYNFRLVPVLIMFLQLVHRVSEGFDIDEAFKDLEEKYGLEEETKKSSRPSKKSKIEEVDIEAEDAQPKKAKKTEVVANEENRGIADAILEMATIYFKNKDARKGGSIL